MKEKIRESLKNKKTAVGGIALAVALIIGVAAVWQPAQEPDFPSFTDPVMEVSIEEEETPLASTPKVVTTTSKKKTTTKVKLKKASKKTYTKKLPTTTKKNTTTSTSGNTTVTKETKVVTATTEKYKKKKKVKTVTTTVTTTIKTTTVTATAQSSDGSDTAAGTTDNAVSAVTEKYEIDVATIAPKMPVKVLNAYKTLGFKVYVDPSVTSYSGYFTAKEQSITLRREDSTIYHELGHFLAFIANNYDRGSSFSSVYSSEKDLYTGVNKTYVIQSASEYFAESVRDYINDASALKASRPKTFEAVETALNMITDTQVARIQRLYGAYWN